MTQSIAADHLRSYLDRVERLESEKDAISEDVKSVYAEAKSSGFCPKTIRQIVRMRKQDPNKRAEQEAILETYMASLGMLPLFDEPE